MRAPLSKIVLASTLFGAACIIAVGLAGCTPSGEAADVASAPTQASPCDTLASEGISIRTGRRAYSIVNDSLVMEVIYTNCTGRTAYATGASSGDVPHFLEKKVDGAWVSAFGPPAALIYIPPEVFPPGDTSKADVVLTRFPPPEELPEEYLGWFVEEIPGTYRLVGSFHWNWNEEETEGELIPKALRVSNPFEIRE